MVTPFDGWPSPDWSDVQGSTSGAFVDSGPIDDSLDVTFGFLQVDVPASPVGILIESGGSGDGMGLSFDGSGNLVGAAGHGSVTSTTNNAVFVTLDAVPLQGKTVNIYWCLRPRAPGRGKIYAFEYSTGSFLGIAYTDIPDGSKMGTQDAEGDWTGGNNYGIGVPNNVRSGINTSSFNGTMNQGAVAWGSRLPDDFDSDQYGVGNRVSEGGVQRITESGDLRVTERFYQGSLTLSTTTSITYAPIRIVHFDLNLNNAGTVALDGYRTTIGNIGLVSQAPFSPDGVVLRDAAASWGTGSTYAALASRDVPAETSLSGQGSLGQDGLVDRPISALLTSSSGIEYDGYVNRPGALSVASSTAAVITSSISTSTLHLNSLSTLVFTGLRTRPAEMSITTAGSKAVFANRKIRAGLVVQTGGILVSEGDRTTEGALVCTGASVPTLQGKIDRPASLVMTGEASAQSDCERTTRGQLTQQAAGTFVVRATRILPLSADFQTQGSTAYFAGYTRWETISLQSDSNIVSDATRRTPASYFGIAQSGIIMESDLIKIAAAFFTSSGDAKLRAGLLKNATFSGNSNVYRITEVDDNRTTEGGDTRITSVEPATKMVADGMVYLFSGGISQKTGNHWVDLQPLVKYDGLWVVPDKVFVKTNEMWRRTY